MRELDFRSLHTVYATWRGRVPAAQPRRVHVACELLANPDRAGYRDGLSAVVREIAFGEDLRPRMSTAIEHAYTPQLPPLLARRERGGRHLDRLLADWGIHHLHLGSERHRSRPDFMRRSSHALLAAFQPFDAYLIDLRSHESDGANWSELAVLEVIARNWPDAAIMHPSNFATGLVGGNRSDEDRRKLREAGVKYRGCRDRRSCLVGWRAGPDGRLHGRNTALHGRQLVPLRLPAD